MRPESGISAGLSILAYVAQLGQNFHCFRLLGLQNPYVLRSGKVFLAM
jgi:hypothetical protein